MNMTAHHMPDLFLGWKRSINREWKMLTLHAIYDRDTIKFALFLTKFDIFMKGHRPIYGVLTGFWLVKASRSIDTY